MGKRVTASKELEKIYKDAWEEGIWLLEFVAEKGFLVAAGSVKALKAIKKRTGKKIDIGKFTLGDCVLYLKTVPGLGHTREEACKNAVKAFKEQTYKNTVRAFKKDYRKTRKGWVRKQK